LSRQGDRTSRKLLITGGSGYLGRWVVRLAADNWDVSATYLTNTTELHALDVEWRQLDVRHQPSVEALIAELRPKVIVHTAALNPGQGTEFHAVNAEGTRHVAHAAAAVGARLIHVSTDVLFDGEKESSGEEDPPSPITPYGRSKALAEEAVRASAAEAVIVRTSLIYGPAADVPASRDTHWHQWDRQTRWIVGDLESDKPVHLFTDELRCPIWVRSLASALVELADRTYTGVLHIAGAQALSRYAFGCRLARFHGVDPKGITPALSRESGLVRPLDCTLDCSRARTLLHTPLPGVDAALERYS
jgi:dTDP-4-dehydrorhamnose reductase